jgi:hypothetical protein
MFLLRRCSYVAFLSNKNIKLVVFDYILPIYFVILYNTMGMSHLKGMVVTLIKNIQVQTYHIFHYVFSSN